MFPLCVYSISNSNITETFIHNQNFIKATADLSTIGSRIRYYRLLNNLTQEQLAIKSGLDRATIIRYENNQVDPSIDILNQIAAVLGIIPSIIYDDYLKFINSNYGRAIKKIRMKLKLSQKSLGKLLGVHRKTISKWESEKSYPTRENFMKLMNISYEIIKI